MEIKAITVNAAGTVAAEKGVQGIGLPSAKQGQVQAEGKDIFGAECKVTISREGKELSRQQAEQTEKGAQSAKTEKMIRRGQEEAAQDKSMREEYRDRLDEIDKKVNALNSSYEKKKQKDETIAKQQEVLKAMRNLKEFQEEQSQRLVKEARQAAMQSAGYQNEIDEGNRDLLTLLRTMEKAEEGEAEREGEEAAECGNDDGMSGFGTENTVSDVIRNSANQYMMSSAEGEWGVQEAITDLGDLGHYRLNLADTVTKSVLETTKNIRRAMDDEAFTDEQIADMMKLLEDGTLKPGLAEEMRRRGFKVGMQLVYDDIGSARSWGLQNLQDAQELKIQHFGDNTGISAQETKKNMMMSAVDAAIGEERQGALDRTSQELEDEVEELIDRRNDVTDKTPEEQEEKKAEEDKAEEEKAEKEKAEAQKESAEKAQEESGSLLWKKDAGAEPFLTPVH